MRGSDSTREVRNRALIYRLLSRLQATVQESPGPTFGHTVTALFFVCVATTACLMPMQNDTWWHLRAGEEMWRRAFVMLNDEFSFTAQGAHWPNHQWLGEVVFYPFYELGGLPMLTLFAASCVTLTVWLSWQLMQGRQVVRLGLMALAISSVAPGWTVRPHIFSQLCLLLTVHLALRRVFWPLPLMFVVWANLHGAVVLGLLVLTAATAADLYTSEPRRAMAPLMALGVSAIATLLTPLGVDLWMAIPESIDKSVANGIAEWRSPAFGWHEVGFWFLAAALVGVVAVRWRRLTLTPDVLLTALTLLLLPLAIRHVRNVTSFALIAVPVLSRLLPTAVARIDMPRQRVALNVTIIVAFAIGGVAAVVTAWSAPAERLKWTPVSDAIVQGIQQCPGRLYNRFDDGGYVIWFARVPVFADSRQDPYPLEFLQEHLHTEISGANEHVFDKYDLACAFLPRSSPTAKRLSDDGWEVATEDGRWVVMRKTLGTKH
jgi:hypothetical protein